MIKIITDSGSDITVEEGKALGIEVIPLEVKMDDTVYFDGDTLSKDDFYEKLEKCKELPKTSQINPYRFEEAYQNIIDDGDEALVITLSSKLSGTYQSAVMAKGDKEQIHVMDSHNVALGERLLVMYAKDLIDQGKTLAEIIPILEDKKRYIRVIAKLDTLKYLRKGGRISGFAAFAGEALNIKPIIGIVDGSVKLLGKGRGVNLANKVLTKLISESGGIDETMPFGTVYSGNSDELIKKYIAGCQDLIKTGKEIRIYRLGATIGTHIGPNGIGLAFFAKED